MHAISELGFTGAAGALVIGIDPVVGMLGGSLVVGLVLGLLSVRGRERDSAIGAVLAFGLGLGVLFLSLYQGYATEATNLLFGSIVSVSDAQLRALAIVGAIVLAGLAVPTGRCSSRASIRRSLRREASDPCALGAIFLLLALTTAEAIQVVGVLLVLTLVITPAAAAQRLTGRPRLALLSASRSRSSRPRAGSCSRSRSRGRRASSSRRSRSPSTSRLGSTTGAAAVSAASAPERH